MTALLLAVGFPIFPYYFLSRLAIKEHHPLVSRHNSPDKQPVSCPVHELPHLCFLISAEGASSQWPVSERPHSPERVGRVPLAGMPVSAAHENPTLTLLRETALRLEQPPGA
ncbi:hypothetical protein AAFF_G00150800 [Aldrovandia affinis]|uniref:Uncharacterized protein n=1 Tax=Aldrovandia affinis TaxID=143900 RepID=A0AAD7W9F9_9TELE|nr:hypothetical protein AAFF_G00150800 [Aldrovandia affinis]